MTVGLAQGAHMGSRVRADAQCQACPYIKSSVHACCVATHVLKENTAVCIVWKLKSELVHFTRCRGRQRVISHRFVTHGTFWKFDAGYRNDPVFHLRSRINIIISERHRVTYQNVQLSHSCSNRSRPGPCKATTLFLVRRF